MSLRRKLERKHNEHKIPFNLLLTTLFTMYSLTSQNSAPLVSPSSITKTDHSKRKRKVTPIATFESK